ncbi:MAG: hypothetical protein H7240_04945 [Glaciimonas sp.]|nr:hypothetical protein [Glaciimonas sp.]
MACVYTEQVQLGAHAVELAKPAVADSAAVGEQVVIDFDPKISRLLVASDKMPIKNGCRKYIQCVSK